MRINSVPDVKCFCNNKNVLCVQSVVWHFVRRPVFPLHWCTTLLFLLLSTSFETHCLYFFSNYMKNSLFHTVKQSGILLLALLKYSSHLSLRHWKQRCRIIYLSLKPRPISFVNIIYKIMRQYPCWSLTSSVTWPASHVTQNLRSYIHLLQSTIFAVTSLSKFEPYSFPMCRIKFFFQYKFTKLQCISPSPPGS